MATVVNNPAPAHSEGDGGMGFVLGVIIVILFAALFLFYGIPYLANTLSNTGAGTQAPQVQVPEKVDVNVNQK